MLPGASYRGGLVSSLVKYFNEISIFGIELCLLGINHEYIYSYGSPLGVVLIPCWKAWMCRKQFFTTYLEPSLDSLSFERRVGVLFTP